MTDRSEPSDPGLGSPSTGVDPPRPVIQPGRVTTPKEHVEFSAFYREFVPALVAFVMWLGAPPHEAAEVAQEAMIEAFRHWSTIRYPQAWVRTVASRTFIRRLATVHEPAAEEALGSNPLLPPQTQAAEWEQRHEVLRILGILPPRQRQVMAWTFDGYTPSQTAEELGLSPEAVRRSLARARKSLAEHLRAERGELPR